VVVGAKTRLAIACDGDTWQGPAAYARELARQRDLERCGWRFFRIRESAFYVDEAAVLDGLWATLRELDIRPSGWEASEAVPEESAVDSPPVAHLDLAPYEEFTGALPPALDATRSQLVDGLRAIVAVEGPIVGHRLHAVYVKSSGGQRVGKLIANALNAAIAAAVRDGVLVEENPLQSQGLRSRTYRLPDQPSVRVRTLGPRAFEHLPPAELAAMLSLAAAVTGWSDEESLYRTTLDLLGLKRLTPNVSDHLRAVRSLTP
jgi:restriction endonuclease-like protein